MTEKFKRWLRKWALDLIVAPIVEIIERQGRELKDIMATQEERLQAIFTKVSEAVDMLKTLKDNNPAIEDEIAAIETKLSEIAPAPVEPPV